MQTNIKFLKDDQLEASLEKLVVTEREILHQIIRHIQEVDRRKIYLQRSYPSLFAYLCEKLKYSPPAAQRRIEAARLAQQLPAVIEKIQTGALNLSSIGEIQRSIKAKEQISRQKVSLELKQKLIDSSVGKSSAETQKACAQILDIPVIYTETCKAQKDDSRQVTMTLTANQFQKLEKTKGLMAAKLLKKGTVSLPIVLEELCDLFLDKKMGRKLGSQNTTSAAEVKASILQKSAGFNLPNGSKQANEAEPRFSGIKSERKQLSLKTKKIIFHRDQICQWRDHETGRLCGSQFNLQVDHQKPLWAGGGHGLDNLRLLCQQHNLFRYQRGQ